MYLIQNQMMKTARAPSLKVSTLLYPQSILTCVEIWFVPVAVEYESENAATIGYDTNLLDESIIDNEQEDADEYVIISIYVHNNCILQGFIGH